MDRETTSSPPSLRCRRRRHRRRSSGRATKLPGKTAGMGKTIATFVGRRCGSHSPGGTANTTAVSAPTPSTAARGEAYSGPNAGSAARNAKSCERSKKAGLLRQDSEDSTQTAARPRSVDRQVSKPQCAAAGCHCFSGVGAVQSDRRESRSVAVLIRSALGVRAPLPPLGERLF